MSVTDWYEIIEKHKPILLIESDKIVFYPSEGDGLVQPQKLTDTKTFFVSAVSHELFTPVTAIIGLVQMAKDGIYVQETLQKIEKHALKMQRILEQLVVLSKVEKEDFVPNLTELNLETLIKEILEEFKGRIEEKNLSFSINTRGLIKVDREAFKIALRNLISNAVKYSPHGGEIKIHFEKNVLSIEDRGVGIPESELKNVTARFYRASNVRTVPGSGLGLAIVKHILRRFNIVWAIHSKLNQGTKVFIKIERIDQSK
ncbi:sensor histidine kinase [Pseudothermotoga sp.]|nr:HAMP domain-containing histidine kinase [Pseudothermotoga sp.]MCX7812226.1 HAMP domain-containing histidine kinase [Pseudothermotoga sp.]MDW8139296.1 HAMP domain-containing sensor histidine kinase [Pseudothermotoga sp.]